MKIIASLACLLLTTLALPAFADEATADSCAANFEKIADSTERRVFLESCMAELANPERIAKAQQRYKERLCDKNAKGMELVDAKKTEYLEHCYHDNEALQQFKAWQQKDRIDLVRR